MKRLIAAVGISMGIFGSVTEARAVEMPIIQLYPGHGTTINFRLANEKVQRLWLDDPSQVTIDFDDVNCRTPDKPCAAQIVHLRRIKPLKFDGLPTTATPLLTIVTDQNIHQFQLAFPATGKPQSAIVNITSPVKPRSYRRSL
jgi:hypothetical protein